MSEWKPNLEWARWNAGVCRDKVDSPPDRETLITLSVLLDDEIERLYRERDEHAFNLASACSAIDTCHEEHAALERSLQDWSDRCAQLEQQLREARGEGQPLRTHWLQLRQIRECVYCRFGWEHVAPYAPGDDTLDPSGSFCSQCEVLGKQVSGVCVKAVVEVANG